MNIYEDIQRLMESEESQVTGIDSLLKGNSQFRYQMLSRMKSDCDYYLGYGNRNERDLWANSVEKQLDYMQKLYDSFPEGEKPEWITQEELDNYRVRMLDSNEDNGPDYHIKNPTVIEDKDSLRESNLKTLVKDLPNDVMYKGKKYVAYPEMSSDTDGELSRVYYCNPKSMPSGDPQESDDYFVVEARLKKVNNGYKGVDEILSVDKENLKESEIKEYRYITTHGTGPGTLPKDVNLIKSEDINNSGRIAIYVDRPLTDEELKKYNIKPEWIQESSRILESNIKKLDESLNEDEGTDNFEKIINTLKNIITSCGGDISYINRKYQDSNEIELSARFKPDKFSKYENDVNLYGTLYLDDNLKLVSSNLMSSSGPNVLNYDYIKCLNALYSYFSSGNSHYDI